MLTTMSPRPSFILLSICIIFLSSSDIASACGCYSYSTVLEGFEKANLVMIARVVSLEKATDGKGPYGSDINSATMVVEKVFKGDVKINEKLTFGQGDEVLGCSWSFSQKMIDRQYLLYVYKPEGPLEPWHIGTCDRSPELEYAQDDLRYLNNIDKMRGHTRISGVLQVESMEDMSFEGRKIRIIGRHKTYIATTDKNGVYELYDLPPGNYVLEPELKFGWKVDEFHQTRQPTRRELMHGRTHSNRVAFTLRPRRDFGADIKLELSNHISGTIYDSNSKPMQWVCVSLVPANDESFLACNSLTDELGRFQIDSVEAGTYVIILNHENKRTTSMPFPKLYYPGVTEREKAKVITVKHGENVKNLKVVIQK